MTLAMPWCPLWPVVLPVVLLLAACEVVWGVLRSWVIADGLRRLDWPEYWDRGERAQMAHDARRRSER